MAVAGENFLGVSGNVHATRAFGVVPVNVHIRKFGTLPVLVDGAVLLEDAVEVKGVAFANVFNAKVVNNEGE